MVCGTSVCSESVWFTCAHVVCTYVMQGMGGQLNYFGLWLSGNFGQGHSMARPQCTTYGSPTLSSEEEFQVDTLEVWGVGEPPQPKVR